MRKNYVNNTIQKKYDFEHIPNFAYLNKYINPGYLDASGKYYSSDVHSRLCKEIVYQKYFEKYKNYDGKYFENKPFGMIQEEYYLLKYEHFVKIQLIYSPLNVSKEQIRNSNEYEERTCIWYYDHLTSAQIDFLYPR